MQARQCVIMAFAFLGLVLAAGPLWAGVLEQVGPGRMDWGTRDLVASGSSSSWGIDPDTSLTKGLVGLKRRAAGIDARRNLLQALLEVRLDRQWQVEDLCQKRPQLRSQLRTAVHNSPLRFDASGWAIGELELVGPLLEELMPPKAQWSGDRATRQEGQDLQGHTGLIIDAREIALRPALFPRVYDEHGQLVYGPSRVWSLPGSKKGLADYVRTMAAALENPRVGQRPLNLTAFSAQGKNRTDPVILGNTERLQGAAQAVGQANVVIILGRKEALVPVLPGSKGLKGAAKASAEQGVLEFGL